MSKYMPDVYDKQVKVQFFFNEFKRRDANPEGFDSKMKNWYSTIQKYCNEEDRFLIDLAELRNNLECMSIRPQISCLKLVLTNMIKDRKLITLDEFKREYQLCSTGENGWVNWGLNSVKKTFGWFSSTVSDTHYSELIDEQLNDQQRFVNLSVFDRIARQVLNYVKENNLIGQILKYEDVESELCTSLNLDKLQLDLILKFLESKGNCKTADGSVKVIKFDAENATITDKELSLMRLNEAKQMIESDIEKLEEEVKRCMEEAREAIKQGNKSKGLNILKKKARLLEQLTRKNNQYDNIDMLEEQLLNTDTNKQILEVLAKSTQVLKAKQLQPDDLDDLLYSVEEAMESHKSLVHDLSKPIGGQLDEDELEEELNQLIEEDEIEKIAYPSSKVPLTPKPVSQETSSSETDQLFERLRKLKSPPSTSTTSVKKDKVRYALLDDDL